VARRLGPDEVGQGVASPAAPTVVRAAVRLLEEDLRRHWTLDGLASELCVGVFYLVRLFKQWVGVPPIAFANQRRAERAAILLASTDDSVADVGAEVGWPDPSHFARRFRSAYGIGPRAYRVSSRAGRAQASSVAPSPHVATSGATAPD
jgi:AraC family L-rhamnose operon transcriptional activator RhaR